MVADNVNYITDFLLLFPREACHNVHHIGHDIIWERHKCFTAHVIVQVCIFSSYVIVKKLHQYSHLSGTGEQTEQTMYMAQ